jgi:hypothetical protein
MLNPLLDAINVLRDTAWVGTSVVVVVVVAILIVSFGFLARIIQSSHTSDLTRDELRMLKAFNEQAKADPRAFLSVELAAYKAEVDNYEVKLQRLKALGYLRDSGLQSGYLGHRPVRITAKGVRRAEKWR